MSSRRTMVNRFAMWRAMRAQTATGFVSSPEPRTIGLFSRGKQLVAGNFLFAGHLVEAKGATIWDVTSPEPAFAQEAHGFAWLDDLAAVGDPIAKALMKDWVFVWLKRFGRGQGPGWAPDLIGRRLIRWINHAVVLLTARDKAQSEEFYQSLSAQVVFLSRRWREATPGLPRFEALSGLIYAGLALTGMESRVLPAVDAMAKECAREIDESGGIATRNPEELLEVFTLLVWAEQALRDMEMTPPLELTKALVRVAKTLRMLRHADGGLGRFHGGGRGAEGRLDAALATADVKPKTQAGPALAMGFVRLLGGRTSVLLDAASAPAGAASFAAHASSLAFELTSGRRPVIVNCGSGAPFGDEWHKAGRATASHSTFCLEGFSSSRFGGKGQEALVERANVSAVLTNQSDKGQHVFVGHDGWSKTHGLSHQRNLTLSTDGRMLRGKDLLLATSSAERRRVVKLIDDGKLKGVSFALRFHLHPDVYAALDMGGTAVSLALKSGEVWVFRQESGYKLSLEPSVYLEKGRLKPRPSRQIVLSGHAIDFETRILWTLAKAQDTPLAIRDLDREELPVPYR